MRGVKRENGNVTYRGFVRRRLSSSDFRALGATRRGTVGGARRLGNGAVPLACGFTTLQKCNLLETTMGRQGETTLESGSSFPEPSEGTTEADLACLEEEGNKWKRRWKTQDLLGFRLPFLRGCGFRRRSHGRGWIVGHFGRCARSGSSFAQVRRIVELIAHRPFSGGGGARWGKPRGACWDL
jgi:hypothetical protein